ncbi:response regulator [Sneathiella sp. P13V-1]|uniref:response regulator n=1 Tax=Sneathiella sp. P13V-1 TaxID=2697366 RepID=UPI00187B1277|nr:response regulator [Sneathiella sp. P13V-1]MBE7637721.1 response regulator [Sneathiella sp. P13V-1]
MPEIKEQYNKFSSLLEWPGKILVLLPYGLTLTILAALYLSSETSSQDKAAFDNSLYLSAAIFICTTVFCGSLVGLNRYSKYSIFYTVGLFLTGIVILQLQYLLFAYSFTQNGITIEKAGLQLFVTPLYLSSSVITAVFLENHFGKHKSQDFCKAAQIAFGISICFFVFLQHYISRVNIPETLIAIGFTLALTSILVSFAAYLILTHFKDFSTREIRYWSGYALFSGLVLLATPTFLTSNLTFFSAVEIEFVRLTSFTVLMGSMSLHATRVIARDSRQKNYLQNYNKACDITYLGSMQIYEATSFKMAATQCLELIAEKEMQNLAHLILLDDEDISHYWYSKEETSFHTLKLISQQHGISFGEGFLGKILANKSYSSVRNLENVKSREFNRRSIALTEGLVSVFAFPVVSDNEVVAILEFFSNRPCKIEEQSKSSIHLLCRQLARVHKRNRLDMALDYQRELYQELSGLFPNPFAIFDVEKKLVFHNQSFSSAMERLGVKSTENLELSELLTHISYKAICYEDQISAPHWVDDLIAFFIAPIGIKKIKLINGDRMELTCSRLRDGSYVSLWRDVSETHQQKQELANLEDILSSSLQLSSEAILVFDDNMTLSHYNTRAVNLLGLEDEALSLGLTFSEFLKSFQNKPLRSPEFVHKLSDMHLALQKNPNSTFSAKIEYGGQAFDLIAENVGVKGFIIHLHQINQSLLSNTETSLIFNQETAAKDRTKQPSSNFLTVVSHELITPLTGIYAANDLLKTTELSEEQAKHLKIIKKASDELSKLMGDLQDLARIESSNIGLQVETVKLKDILDKIEQKWAFAAHSKGLDFAFNLHKDVPETLSFDARRFAQIVNTLLDNAVKYTNVGSISVHIQNKTDQNGQKLYLEITDTGSGITEDKQKDLFTKFGDLSSFEDASTGLEGLELNLCYNLVELMGGTIGVNSHPGKGSTFWFDVKYQLPDPDQPLAEKETATSIDDIWEENAPHLSILVAEDHPVNQLVITELLQKWGHKVDLVDNGELAVAAVATCKYDLVIMDIQMPEMDGIAATREIRKFPGRINEIPIIALTANIEVGERRRCLDAGMNDYLTKPIKKWELKDTLLTYSNLKKRGEDIWKLKLALKGNQTSSDGEEGALTIDDSIYRDFINTFGHDVVKSLMDKMLEQYEINHANILNFVADADWQGVGREAHMIKSSFGQFGLMKAAAFATQIDVDTKAGEKQKVLENALPLLELCDEAILILKERMSEYTIE